MGLNIQDLAITSGDFQAEGLLPKWSSAEGENRAPRLEISGVPEATVELALILHDPDAPLPRGFTHWVVYGIDPQQPQIAEETTVMGPNGAGEHAYTGPMPPKGHGVHHYYFWIYALDRRVKGAPSREEFLEQYADAIIEQNRLVGLFER
jgi:Raf kinase inhibitor-like YbhB/YbcL family protein